MAVEKKVRVTINFYKKHFLPVVIWNQISLSKQVVPITYTLKKLFFAVAIHSKVCESFFFRQSEKACDILWSVPVFFRLPEKRRPNNYCL